MYSWEKGLGDEGSLFRSTLLDQACDGRQYILSVIFDLMARKSKDLKALLAKPIGANCVLSDTFFCKVRSSIALYDKLCFDTVKVESINPEGMLSTKLRMTALTIAEKLPE